MSTQQERSLRTRKKLVDATLSCLQDYGYAGASLSRILDRAGVSRGAWSHHYETKRAMVADSAKALLAIALEEAREVGSHLASEAPDLETILEEVWNRFYQGPYRDVWVEFNVACRTDADLRIRLTPVIEGFFDELDAIWRSRLPDAATYAMAKDLLDLSLYLLRGMAIQSLSLDRPDHYRHLRQAWASIIRHTAASIP
ncbi:TetR/AcrR family transcriptional regulator [Desulfoluna butyratoxydans]|uniref:Dna-binding hth domain tetr-type n=1 Tax=Desulfoluna butyratoxydans TaxID=231438 RepID=A0A4U8YJG4_9BACT|nr:TetR/AcrR family transcriptional regulator [Desulfoluna butyratoxydans]VFQ43896.1 dna-binding hth domain tetr-type [Desulfoluna butyratoxydans]